MIPRADRRQALGLLAWLGAVFVAAAFGAVASTDAATFYAYVGGLPWRGFEYHVGRSGFAGAL